MPLPTAATVATRCALPTNDARIAPALLAGLSWARTELCRTAVDPLTDLNDAGNNAIAGYCADLLSVESYAQQLVSGTLDRQVAHDIGLRHVAQLCPGNKHAWAIA
jgi:hypothetical protein